MAMENSNECVRTWLEVSKNGLNDSLYYQTHSSFNFKTPSCKSKKEKEVLNDEDRCDQCKEPFDTITLVQNNALCSSCSYPFIIDQSQVSMNLADFNNHLVKVENLLFHLSSYYRAYAKLILPRLWSVIYNWKIGIGMYKINSLRNISANWWHVYDFDVINVTDVIMILREIRDELKLNIENLS